MYPNTVWRTYDVANFVSVEKTTAEIASGIVKNIRKNYKRTNLSELGVCEADAIEMSLMLNSYPFRVDPMQQHPFDNE